MLGNPPELLSDRFATIDDLHNPERATEFDAIFIPWLLEHTREEVTELGQAAGATVMVVNTMKDVLDNRHIKERNYFVEIDHPATGVTTYPGAPFRMMETPWRSGRAPLLGEHNREVYCDLLRYSEEDMVLLREQGVT